MINFELRGLDEVRRRFAPERFQRAVAIGLKAVSSELTTEIRKRTPRKTGQLQRYLRVMPKGDGFVIIFAMPYAGYVERGTKPHMIYPRRAKALRFTVGGRVVFAKRVRHPGTKGAHMVERALKEESGRMLRLFQREVMRAMGAR